jgi:glutamine amidotransferase
MCELLALGFDVPIRPTISFRGLPPDVVRRGLLPPSRIHVAHIRRGEGVRHANTHPFSRILKGREYVFAHNGTLRWSPGELDPGVFPPLGTTDTERAFGHLLTNHADLLAGRNWAGLHRAFQAINRCKNEQGRVSTFNCVLSDGEFLAVYRDLGGHKGLWRVERRPPYDLDRVVRMRVIAEDDEYTEIDLHLDEAGDRVDGGYVYATRQLTNEEWVRLEPGALEIVIGGVLAYSAVGPKKEE